MKRFIILLPIIGSLTVYAQVGHLLQGIGAKNFSMGGAATAQPLDISGALHWNPASISAFNQKEFSFNIGAFMSSPELYSSVTTQQGTFSGTTPCRRTRRTCCCPNN